MQGSEQDAGGGWRTRLYWYRRLITATDDTVFREEPFRPGVEPKWQKDPELSVVHGLGFCPAAWVRTMPTSADPVDGTPVIDPALYRDNVMQKYCTSGDTANCNWLKARIDEAKAQGLWTVVATHKVCITMGSLSCEIGANLLNVLIGRKVDLVLQGHDHGYQRSKELALGTGCTAVSANAYNAACVVDDGADGVHTEWEIPAAARYYRVRKGTSIAGTEELGEVQFYEYLSLYAYSLGIRVQKADGTQLGPIIPSSAVRQCVDLTEFATLDGDGVTDRKSVV